MIAARKHHVRQFWAAVPLLVMILSQSCRKDLSCQDCFDINKNPVANAGEDGMIALPLDSITLDGSASKDPDGKIVRWSWVKVSGPASSRIMDSSKAKTLVRDLDTGVYAFELTIRDDEGRTARDTVSVTVYDLRNNRPPVARAGNDTLLIGPYNSFYLDGSGSDDPDSNITGFRWRQLAGQSTDIIHYDSSRTMVRRSNGDQFQYELKVMDAGGLVSLDTVTVFVLHIPEACGQYARPAVPVRMENAGTLSLARWGMAVATAGNKIVFAGGIDELERYSSVVDVFDYVTGQWTTTNLSLARAGMAVAVLENKIYFAGGWVSAGFSSRVDIYDVVSNSWTTAELSRPRAYLAGAAAGNKVLFAGGFGHFEYDGKKSGVTLVDILDISTNSWTTDTIPNRQWPDQSIMGDAGIAATVIGHKIYLAGNASDWFHWGGGTISSTINVYDALTGQWSREPDLSQARGFAASIAIGNRIIWAGGVSGETVNVYSQGNFSNLVEIRDMSSGTSTLGCLSRHIGFLSAVQQANKVAFITTGIEWKSANPIDIYDTGTNTWSVGILPFSLRGASVIAVNNRIYVAGGFVNDDISRQLWMMEF